MSPALAFLWLPWTRSRRGLSVCAAYMLALVVAANVVAAASPRAVPVVSALLLPCPVAFGYLVAALVLGREARLEARESGFPARLLILPLSTPALVGWPMLWGTTGVVAAWLVLALGVLRPCGLYSPELLWWPP